MTILEILNAANEVYPDQFLAQYYNLKTGEKDKFGSGDTLAEFIVNELIETYVEGDTDAEQLTEATRVMRRAMASLGRVMVALKKKQYEAEDKEVESAMKARGEK